MAKHTTTAAEGDDVMAPKPVRRRWRSRHRSWRGDCARVIYPTSKTWWLRGLAFVALVFAVGAALAVDLRAALSLADNPRFAPLIQRYRDSFPEQISHMRTELSQGDLESLRVVTLRYCGDPFACRNKPVSSRIAYDRLGSMPRQSRFPRL